MTEEWSFDMNDYKACSKCGNTQPLENFRANKASKDGRQSACKSCQKAFYHANREQYREAAASYRKNNREKIRQSNRLYHQRNADKLKAKSRDWYWSNLERVREGRKIRYDRNRARWILEAKKWKQRNPEMARESDRISVHKRRARLQENGVYQITPKDIRRLYQSECIYCQSLDEINLDHVIPIARGGRHSIGNLAPACRSCNQSKGSKTITEWRKRRSPRT
jgi:5-methylcytosine-specific restriction endonuclease McrA